MKFSEMTVGQKCSLSKTYTAADVTLFAGVSLDTNPLHMSDAFAKKSIFGQRIVHGMLTASLISATIVAMIGEGAIYLGQELKFVAPVFLGDTITAELEVLELREDKKIVKLGTTCYKEDGKAVITGSAVVKCTF